MSLQPTLSSSDFQEQPTADARGRVWLSGTQVPSPLGSFSVQIMAAPDNDLLSAANEAVELLREQHEPILNAVYAFYQRAGEDRQWMKAHGVPRNLSRGEIADYISSRSVSVRRAADGRARVSISMRARWDDEHLFLFGVRSGRLVLESP